MANLSLEWHDVHASHGDCLSRSGGGLRLAEDIVQEDQSNTHHR